jgi:hypothetical protein
MPPGFATPGIQTKLRMTARQKVSIWTIAKCIRMPKTFLLIAACMNVVPSTILTSYHANIHEQPIAFVETTEVIVQSMQASLQLWSRGLNDRVRARSCKPYTSLHPQFKLLLQRRLLQGASQTSISSISGSLILKSTIFRTFAASERPRLLQYSPARSLSRAAAGACPSSARSAPSASRPGATPSCWSHAAGLSPADAH